MTHKPALHAPGHSKPSTAFMNLVSEMRLYGSRTPIQSFGFDNDNHQIYALQLDGSSADGHLWVSRLDIQGKLVGHMRLNHCGHGVAMGVQSRGPGHDPWLWTEAHGRKNHEGQLRGTCLMRFRWRKGQTIEKHSSHVQYFHPFPNSSINTCTIDPLNKRMAIRYLPEDEGRGMQISIYKMNASHLDEHLDDYKFICTVKQPGAPVTPGSPPHARPPDFQGYALYGDHLYFLSGNASTKSGPNTVIQMINIHHPEKVEQMPCPTVVSHGREPEGMAIQVIAHPTHPKVRLCFGFSDSQHRASIFYKELLAPHAR